jgi:hypothetical protein
VPTNMRVLGLLREVRAPAILGPAAVIDRHGRNVPPGQHLQRTRVNMQSRPTYKLSTKEHKSLLTWGPGLARQGNIGRVMCHRLSALTIAKESVAAVTPEPQLVMTRLSPRPLRSSPAVSLNALQQLDVISQCVDNAICLTPVNAALAAAGWRRRPFEAQTSSTTLPCLRFIGSTTRCRRY